MNKKTLHDLEFGGITATVVTKGDARKPQNPSETTLSSGLASIYLTKTANFVSSEKEMKW